MPLVNGSLSLTWTFSPSGDLALLRYSINGERPVEQQVSADHLHLKMQEICNNLLLRAVQQTKPKT